MGILSSTSRSTTTRNLASTCWISSSSVTCAAKSNNEKDKSDTLRIAVWCPALIVLAHPQRDMCGLHRLLDDGYQVFAQGCQIHFLAQCGTESCQRASGVILAAIETAVDESLNAMTQG